MRKSTIPLVVLLLTASSPCLVAQITQTNTFGNLNAFIPEGDPAGMVDVRTVTSAITNMSSLRVSFRVAGNFNGDLYGYLRQVQGGVTNFCVLLNRVGRTASNPWGYADCGLNVLFDDAAAQGDIHIYETITNPPPGTPVTGAWQPDGRDVDPALVLDTTPRATRLNSFTNSNPNGVWTLFLADMSYGSTNMLVSWGLVFTGPALPPIGWPAPASIVYGTALGAGQLNATSSVPGVFAYNPPAGTVLNAGTQVLSVTFNPTDTNSYAPVTTNATLTVTPAALTITAANATKLYGASLPSLAASYSGFVNGDTVASLATLPTLMTTATAATSVGSYPIAASGAASPNYSINYANGTLTVTPAALTITAANTSKLYGAPLPALTASYSGFVNGDTVASLATLPTLITTATAATSVGSYPIAASGAASPNYSINYANGTLTITPAALTITAANTSKLYGAPLPALTATYSGFVNGDTVASLATLPTLITTATAATSVGSYSIIASGAASPNYSINYANGTLTITPAAMTITAANASKLYGAPLPALTAGYAGFVNGDTVASLATLPTLMTTATAASPVGSYSIIASGAASPNYTISYAPGTLAVTKASTVGALSSSASPSLPNQAVTFSLSLNAVAPGAGTPTGTVQFEVDGTAAGAPVTLNGGTASYTTANLTHGSHTVGGQYTGDTNFLGVTNLLSPAQVINTPPVAGPVTIDRGLTNGVMVSVADLLGNASDADNDRMTFVGVSAASANGGTLMTNAGWVFYTPAPGFTNTDTFTYLVTDGWSAPVAGTVTVDIAVGNCPSRNLIITTLGTGAVSIGGDGIPGNTYVIQYTTNTPPTMNWLSLGTVTADASGAFTLVEDLGPGLRFYRAIYP